MDQTSFHAQRAVLGERESLAWLVAHFQPLVAAQVRLRLGSVARAEDVEDLCAEVWLVLVRRIGSLAPRDGRWAPVVASFLGTTALQLCNNRSRNRLRRRPFTAPEEGGGSSTRSEDHLAAEVRGMLTRAAKLDLGAPVQLAFDQLSREQREILALRLLENGSDDAIARTLGVQPDTVAVRYDGALEELKARLPEETFEELGSARRV